MRSYRAPSAADDCAPATAVPPATDPAATTDTLAPAPPPKGIDVSWHNKQIDWKTVAGNKDIGFAFMKATEGATLVDKTLSYNSTEAKKAGLKTGYYHFATLNQPGVAADAKTEADFFLKTISTCPPPDLPLILDIEANKLNLPPADVLAWIQSFFARLSEKGFSDYALYSYTPFLNQNLPPNHGLGNIRLWIAAYVNKPAPVLPVGWTRYWLWQYTAKGKVPGIVTDVDMNVRG